METVWYGDMVEDEVSIWCNMALWTHLRICSWRLLRCAADRRMREMNSSDGDRSAPCRSREYSSASLPRGRRLHG